MSSSENESKRMDARKTERLFNLHDNGENMAREWQKKHFSDLTAEELYRILRLRVSVFVVEQNCPYPELDDRDQEAVHVWTEDASGILAYLRVLDRGVESPYVSIGRVVTAKRGMGFGDLVLEEGIQTARDVFGADVIYLEAQTYAEGFYEKHGFHRISEEFLEDGIPHVKMLLEGTEEQ